MDRLEFVRRAVEAGWKTEPEWSVLAEFYDPRHVMVTRTDAIDGGPFVGAEGMRRWLAASGEGMDWRAELREILELDDARVLIVAQGEMRGLQSEIVTEAEVAAILTFGGDGKIARTVVYGSRAEAVAASSAISLDS